MDSNQIITDAKTKLTLTENHFIEELSGAAMIREVHVYGKVSILGGHTKGHTQHLGIGTQLIEIALEHAKKSGYKKIAVISAIGTRDYYAKFGFIRQGLYQVKTL